MKLGLITLLLAKMSMLIQTAPLTMNSIENINITNGSNTNLTQEINNLTLTSKDDTHKNTIRNDSLILSIQKTETIQDSKHYNSNYKLLTVNRSIKYPSSILKRLVEDWPVDETPKNYFTGKRLFYNGLVVDLYRSLLYTEDGKIKKFITTPRGKKYRINKVDNWLQVHTKDNIVLSILPQIKQYQQNNKRFNFTICSIYFQDTWNKPLEMNLLFNNNNYFVLSFIQNTKNNNMVDIGYYKNVAYGSSIKEKNLANDDAGTNSFVVLASIPKSSKINLAIFNKVSSNILDNDIKKKDNRLFIPAFFISPNNSNILKNMISTPPPAKAISQPIINKNNNIIINSFLDEKLLSDKVESQLVIFNYNKVISSLPLVQRVNKFFINNYYDPLFSYSMNDM
jgi:hypothetical protein